MPKVLVIIVNYHSAELTINSVRSLESARRGIPHLRVSVIENASGDSARLNDEFSREEFKEWVTTTDAPVNGGFAYGNNVALREALLESDPPDYFFLLNPDTEVRPGALEALLNFAESHENVGIVGAKIEDRAGVEWNWAFRFPSISSELDSGLHFGPVTRLLKNRVVTRPMGQEPTRVDWLPGAALLIRRNVFETIGLMDESYFLYYEETDFCLTAARAGVECWYYPHARVMHIAGQSTGVTSQEARGQIRPPYWFESRRRYFIKNHGLAYATAADVAYIAGAALFGLRMKLQGKTSDEPPNLLLGLLKNFSLWPTNQHIAAPKNK